MPHVMARGQRARSSRPWIGPHEGRELRLMKAGKKPLCIFVQVDGRPREHFPAAAFNALVEQGKLCKAVAPWRTVTRDGEENRFRHVLYALPGEEWRIKAALLVDELYESLLPGWRPDLERVTGLLLGYDRQDIERYVAGLPV